MSAAMFDQLDKNHDGVITRQEFMQAQAQPAAVTYAAPAARPSGSISIVQPTVAAPVVQQSPGFFSQIASYFQRPAAPVVAQPAGSITIVQPAASTSLAQPATSVLSPTYAAQSTITAAPVTYAAPAVAAIAAPTVSNLRPHPSLPPAEISSVTHPPQRVQHVEAQPISYVGPSGGPAHLITNPANYQQTLMHPTTEYHPVHRFVEQAHIQQPGAVQQHVGSAFGPRMALGQAAMATASPVTYAAPLATTSAAPAITYGAPPASPPTDIQQNEDGKFVDPVDGEQFDTEMQCKRHMMFAGHAQ